MSILNTVTVFMEILFTSNNARRRIYSGNTGILANTSLTYTENIIAPGASLTLGSCTQLLAIQCDTEIQLVITKNSVTQTHDSLTSFVLSSSVTNAVINNTSSSNCKIIYCKV